MGDDFSRFPVVLEAVDEEAPATFTIIENESGPLIQLSLSCGYDSGGSLIIPPNMMSYQDECLNPFTGLWEKAGEKVKAAYKDIQARMKRLMVRHKGAQGFFWIGNDAFRLIKEGKAKTSMFGFYK